MKRKVIAYLHTHWDREWYKTHEEFNIRLLDVFDEVIDELKKGKAPSFYFDGQTDALENYLKFRPEKLNIIKKIIKDKKLFIGPFSVSADSFLSSGFLLLKNFENGLKYAKNLGCKDFIGYLPDTFGHSKSIFEIIKYLGLKNAVVWRGTPDIESDFIFNDLKTTRLVRGYFFDFFHNNAPVDIIEENIDKIAKYTNSKDILLPIGADHLQILTNAKEKIEEFNKNSKKYEIILSNPFEYIKKAYFKKKYDGEFLDNSSTYILQGVYSARIPQKVMNAKNQWFSSRIVEPFDILTGSKYASSLDFAYKTLIKNHAHDSIYGCSIDEVHRQVAQRFERVWQISNYVKNKIIRFEKEKLEKSNGNLKLCAYNFSNFDYDIPFTFKSTKKIKGLEIVNKEKGFPENIFYDRAKIPITEDYCDIYEYIFKTKSLKPFSKNVIEIDVKDGSVKIGKNFIENQNIKLSVKDGKINIINKLNHKTYHNCLKFFDTKDGGDSYNYAPTSKDVEIPFIKTKIIKDGKLKSILSIFYKNIEVQISLKDNAKFLEFNVVINNKTKNHKIKAKFKVENDITETIAEDGFGIITRKHNPDYSLVDSLPVEYPKEAKTNCFPMQRFVWTQGIGIVTIGLNEYEIYKNTLSISLLRSFGIVSNPKNIARSIPAGPPIETPEAQLQGVQNVSFCLSFAEKPFDMFKISEQFYNPIVAFDFEGKENLIENKFLNIPKNCLFYGFKDKTTAIVYDFSVNKIKEMKI